MFAGRYFVKNNFCLVIFLVIAGGVTSALAARPAPGIIKKGTGCSLLLSARSPESVAKIQDSKISRYDADTLLDFIPAVHTTQYLPVGGIVRSGGAPDSFRPELHFSLGEVVRSHRDGYWEHMPFAIVTNLRRLEPQLLNIMVYDTYILGDLKMRKNDYLVMPENRVEEAPDGLNVITYDPTRESLRSAVDALIARLKWWPIRGQHEMGRIHHPATLDGVNVNVREFFEPILSRHPQISFGGHGKSQTGMASVFGYLDLHFMKKIRSFLNGSESSAHYPTENLNLDLDLARDALTKADQLASLYNAKYLNSYKQQRRRLNRFINIVEAEVRLRRELRRSLFLFSEASDNDFREALFAQADTPARLSNYLKTIEKKILPIISPHPLIDERLIAEMAFLAPAEFETFANKHNSVSIFTAPRIDYARLAYALERFLIIGFDLSHGEGLLTYLESSAKSAALSTAPEFFKEIFKFYFGAEHLGAQSSRLTDVEKLFGLPNLQIFLAAQMDMHLPSKPVLTLKEILMAHPETREAFESFPKLFYDATVVDFLKAIPYGGVQGQDYSSLAEGFALDYKSAEAAAQKVRRRENPFVIEKYLYERPTEVGPPAQTGRFFLPGDTILGGIKNRYPEELIQIWIKLNLQKEFRQRFPTDEDFWQCDTPLLQIYRELLATRG